MPQRSSHVASTNLSDKVAGEKNFRNFWQKVAGRKTSKILQESSKKFPGGLAPPDREPCSKAAAVFLESDKNKPALC
ncbi:unnamed protein product [Didymodactylos carnosus]|uniref:Uncharacterized protein n=1 Tax=Didymodactylos carnosus TaxID=1234261 RepID=A0A814F9F0_9BILA|nr:unnamed protein product [Didymodactylos carnosus]CAF0985094.1 unnamed protein product [Didymodactylos carnosus]CAF3751278.1 unnamed protein product [Didymodactylos carnosus]CAF3755448.1 unnamed protein product [Didymodactylos carnosus]